jgi:hypothetical protein
MKSKRLQGLEALELPPSNEDLDAIAQRRDERHSDEILLAEPSAMNGPRLIFCRASHRSHGPWTNRGIDFLLAISP